MKKLISVIIPFYKGNEYIGRALKSIENVSSVIRDTADVEVIIINDSPDIEVILPDTNLDCKVFNNEVNSGIHRSRINGLKKAKGEYIQFLDQDDELIPDGYIRQLDLIQDADIVVGNGFYSLNEKKFIIYKSYASMKYLIQLERMLKIRNLIPSPGECLIKRNSISKVWSQNPLSIDGADDWMLWICMLKEKSMFKLNLFNVYRHNNARGANLSADLEKMRESAIEANKILLHNKTITDIEARRWYRAIVFKCLQDTNRLSAIDVVKYSTALFDNICYRITLFFTDKIL